MKGAGTLTIPSWVGTFHQANCTANGSTKCWEGLQFEDKVVLDGILVRDSGIRHPGRWIAANVFISVSASSTWAARFDESCVRTTWDVGISHSDDAIMGWSFTGMENYTGKGTKNWEGQKFEDKVVLDGTLVRDSGNRYPGRWIAATVFTCALGYATWAARFEDTCVLTALQEGISHSDRDIMGWSFPLREYYTGKSATDVADLGQCAGARAAESYQ